MTKGCRAVPIVAARFGAITMLCYLTSTSTSVIVAQSHVIRIEPNILVSREPATSHAEMYIAAHPTDPKKLIGTATVFVDVGGRLTNAFYASADGGQTWTNTTPDHQRRHGSGDPWVGFTRAGTAFGVALIPRPEKLEMWGYRSPDGGFRWTDTVLAGWGDHERLGIDYGTGQFAGRMYLAAEYSHPSTRGTDKRHSLVGVWRSDDDGRTWIGPVIGGESVGTGLQMSSIGVLKGGRVVLFMMKYPHPGSDLTTPHWENVTAVSDDGGVSFGPLQSVGRVTFGGYAEMRNAQAAVLIHGWSFEAAVDPGSSRFADRMYITFSETRKPLENRIMAQYSGDRGATWSTPKEIAAISGVNLTQFVPSIAVNRDGTVGVMWLDTRASEKRDRWDAYFTASVDGGESWLPAARVSTESSFPFTPENLRPVPYLGESPGSKTVNVNLTGPASAFPEGGHYLGMAADAGGVFHPLWTDGRAGAYQMMTARIRVEQSTAKATIPGLERTNVTTKVALDLDPTRLDGSKSELVIPIRIKNVSSDTLYGPLSVEVKNIGTGGDAAGVATTLLNGSNAKPGAGATMDYGKALRDMGMLLPGAVTDAVLWRVKLGNPRHSGVSISAEVFGSVRAR